MSSASSRRRWACALLVVITCIGLPALAVKPGNNAQRSTATVTISLVVKPSVTIKRFTRSELHNTFPSPSDNARYLCVNTHHARNLSFYLLPENVSQDGSALGTRWASLDRLEAHHGRDATCAVSVPLHVDHGLPSDSDTLTVIVSPE